MIVGVIDIGKSHIRLTHEVRYKKLLIDCYVYASKSPHPSTHTAALLLKGNKILLRGMNQLPPRVRPLRERFQGDNKHLYPNHAERDVIFTAAKRGIATNGLTMVMPWLPCIPCANAIISAGVKKLIVHRQMIERTSGRWEQELKEALQILHEAKVVVTAYDGTLGVSAYMHKKLWEA